MKYESFDQKNSRMEQRKYEIVTIINNILGQEDTI
jgi:hypothetical protein